MQIRPLISLYDASPGMPPKTAPFVLASVSSGKYGAYLLACYEPDREEYQSVCKIGTGFTDEILNSFWEELKEHTVEQRPRCAARLTNTTKLSSCVSNDCSNHTARIVRAFLLISVGPSPVLLAGLTVEMFALS